MTRPIYPASHAALLVSRAGEKYRPSNSTEGQVFLSAFCRQCQRDRRHTHDRNCEILDLTLATRTDDPEYPTAWQYGRDGQPCCTQFIPAGEQIPAPRCDKTLELF